MNTTNRPILEDARSVSEQFADLNLDISAASGYQPVPSHVSEVGAPNHASILVTINS